MIKKSLSCIIVTVLFLSELSAGEQKKPFLFFEESEIVKLKTEVKNPDKQLQPYLKELKELADFAIKHGPWSVTDYKSPSISSDPHDYYSESPYWWPDPDDPQAPFIRKDGLRNPERFMHHKSALNRVYQSTFVLILAGYLFDKPEYTLHALKILDVWFINPETRMNPNLNYAQAIPNKSPGRGVGIIDTHRFSTLMEAFNILGYSGKWPEKHRNGLINWFSEYLTWLTESKNGLDEKNQGNNHTTWWCAQVSACSRFVDNDSLLQMVLEYVKTDVIQHQIEENGSMPEEEARTRSLSYVVFNLDAYAVFISSVEQNLWQYKNEKGGSVKKAIDYIVPFMKNPDKWPHQQITKPSDNERIFLYLAGRNFSDESYYQMYENRRRPRKQDKTDNFFDPFILLCNLVSATK